MAARRTTSALTIRELTAQLRSADAEVADAARREITRAYELARHVRRPKAEPADAGALADELADTLARTVRGRLAHLEPGALRLLGPAHEVAEAWAAQLPLAASPLEELTGPFYDTSSLRRWLGVTRQALDSRVRHRSILALVTGDGARVYPAWQWRPDKSTVPHLGEVLALLLAGARDPWTVALWLTAPLEWGDGRELPAWKWLAEDGDPSPVLDEARVDSARWAS